MFSKSSISWGSVASLVFKYLTSSKMPTFNCLKWYVFPAWILSIMPSHKTSFTELVSSAIRQSLLYFAFSPSFTMTCLFSAFLRTLALTSTVSYRSFPSAWVIVHSRLLKLSLKENDREAGEIFACFAMVNSSSCVWNLLDGVCFTPIIFTADLLRNAWFKFVRFWGE